MSNRIVLNNKSIKNKDKLVKDKKKKKPPFTLNDAYSMMTPEMREAMKHKAGNIWMITGKEYGKGYTTGLKLIGSMEEDYRANGFALKKYKTNAGEKLHRTFANIVTEIKFKGFQIPEYEKGQNVTYRIINRNKKNNASIEYGSFEDYNSITGTEAYNLGFYPMVIFDEPSQLNDDPAKIPKKSEWDSNVKAMKSSISRSNNRHMVHFKRKVQPTQYYYTLNPWDDHPLVIEAEKLFPEEDFYNFIKKDLLKNHTMQKYIEEIDTLIVRGTKFGNPIINAIEKTLKDNNINNLTKLESKKGELKIDKELGKKYFINYETIEAHLKRNQNKSIYKDAMDAIKDKNPLLLAETLGLKYVQESKYKRVYNLENLQLADTDKILKNMDACSRQIIGWDIDQRKGGKFIMTPMWIAYKQTKDIKIVKNIIVGKQVQINSNGMGDRGQHIMRYFERKKQATIKAERDFWNKAMFLGAENRALVTVDDNSKHFIRLFAESLPHLSFTATKFKTKEEWRIIKRQKWLQTAIDSGYLIIDERNLGLIKDLKASVSKEGKKQRDESGIKSKNYDRINSMEYAAYYLRKELVNDYPPGTLEKWGLKYE